MGLERLDFELVVLGSDSILDEIKIDCTSLDGRDRIIITLLGVLAYHDRGLTKAKSVRIRFDSQGSFADAIKFRINRTDQKTLIFRAFEGSDRQEVEPVYNAVTSAINYLVFEGKSITVLEANSRIGNEIALRFNSLPTEKVSKIADETADRNVYAIKGVEHINFSDKSQNTRNPWLIIEPPYPIKASEFVGKQFRCAAEKKIQLP